MRLWTLHPRYLDAKGLVAAWREALLAQKVLAGLTRGYRNHPQLTRFLAHPQPLAAIAGFLTGLADEAGRRGYRFDAAKITGTPLPPASLDETRSQLLYEWEHLKAKLRVRAPDLYRKVAPLRTPEPHPLFRIVPGGIRDWEIRT
ncbi:pyrimidine dimer DNA glycosylase /DNA-(apurinic or apyrimidinic site) lyase [Opitutaceae bacterium TAV5]|nr:pyrimidine dimer DNA glycosylase /DNA-(apurinic or apyrimidinic site) lyase [Opitutaceae bacterium TAV5]